MGGFSKLTPHNYASWKYNVKEPLVEKGLLHYVNGIATKPADNADEVRKEDWETKQEMALGTLFKHISDPVKYHVRKLTSPTEVWDKLKTLYGTVDEDMAYTIEANLLKLDPKSFDSIKDYLTQVDDYRAQLSDCGEPIKDGKLIKHIITHLPSEYATFVSSYHTHKLTMGANYIKPSFEKFSEMLVHENTSLLGMGILKSSKSKALVANEDNSGNRNSNKNQKQSKDKSQADTQQSFKHQSSSTQQKG